MPSLSGGPSHVRYGHRCRPRDLEVRCPRCGDLATARKPSEACEKQLIGDLSPSWTLDDWEVACRKCTFRAGALSYDALPACFWCFDVGRFTVWAWNREHFAFIRRYLLGQADDSGPYAWLGTYVPGEWKANAQLVAKAIEKRLDAEGPA